MMQRCTRCILPETYPGIEFNEDGICNQCVRFDKLWGDWIASERLQLQSERKLKKILAWAKAKNCRYDALVPVSGGKDSSYALYLFSEVYGLNVLAFTNNNGFLAESAKRNIKKLIEKLNIDHVYHEDPLMLDLASVFFRKSGHFCAPCELGTFNSNYMIAQKYDIPLIVYGSSSKTDAGAPKHMNPWDPYYFRKVLKGEAILKKIPNSLFGKNYLKTSITDRLLNRRRFILLPNYLIWNEEEHQTFLSEHFGLKFDGEHSDCAATGIADYLYKARCGGVDGTTRKYALLIRNGFMDRETALHKIQDSTDEKPESLDTFLKQLNMTQEDFTRASQLTPDPYLKGIPSVFNKVRRMIRKQD